VSKFSLKSKGLPVRRQPFVLMGSAFFIASLLPFSMGWSAGDSFVDTFDQGISTDVWRVETIQGKQWRSTTSFGGCIVSETTGNKEGVGTHENPFLDILTRRQDFRDFVMTWDIRFESESWHSDHRVTYLRSQWIKGQTSPYGIELLSSVWIPYPEPGDYIKIRKRTQEGRVLGLTDLQRVSWDLETWYTIKVVVNGQRVQAKYWKRDEKEPDSWIIEARLPHRKGDSQIEAGAIGFGNYWSARTYIDNVHVQTLTSK